ncbi:PilZ domain-containing protein [Candidatus Uhrbacteria bacterium]|nr:PilZ domain-containing protein [Candidatus Uhrbacteria bacterium]
MADPVKMSAPSSLPHHAVPPRVVPLPAEEAERVVVRAAYAGAHVLVRLPGSDARVSACVVHGGAHHGELALGGWAIPVRVPAGATVAAEFVLGASAYRVEGRVIRCEAEIVALDWPVRVLKVQRRRYFRVPAPPGVEVVFRVQDRPRVRPLLDLSASGIGLQLDLAEDGDVREDTPVEAIQVPLGSAGWFVGQGVTRRVVVPPAGSTSPPRCGIELVHVREAERDRLVAWVLARERELLAGAP